MRFCCCCYCFYRNLEKGLKHLFSFYFSTTVKDLIHDAFVHLQIGSTWLVLLVQSLTFLASLHRMDILKPFKPNAQCQRCYRKYSCWFQWLTLITDSRFQGQQSLTWCGQQEQHRLHCPLAQTATGRDYFLTCMPKFKTLIPLHIQNWILGIRYALGELEHVLSQGNNQFEV